MEMFCPSTEESSGSLNLLAHQYLERNHSVQPKSAKEQCPKPSQENTKFSNIAIFPLFDQIKLIMNRGEKDVAKNGREDIIQKRNFNL